MANISADAQAVLSQAGPGAQEYVLSKGGFGGRLTSGEATSLLQGFTPQPTVGQQVQTGISNLASQQYQFDPNQYLPQIQQQAEGIYSPQQAQLEAIRQLQQNLTVDTRIQTEKDFEKRLRQETEAINARGGFFSGGAIQNEQDIRGEQARALRSIDLQQSAADFSNLAQQGLLQAEKAQFIQDRLVNSESSAYARWTDQRNFSLQALTTQYQIYSNERDFARSVFESDRQYGLQEKQLKMQAEQFKAQFKLTEAQFKMAKQEFNLDMKIKGLSYDSALSNFKNKYAVNNSGVFGVDETGNDIEQNIYNSWSAQNLPSGGFTSNNSSINWGF